MSGERASLTYLGYYPIPGHDPENRNCSPAAVQKMDYVMTALNKLGYAVNIVSASRTLGRVGRAGRVVPLPGNNTLQLLPTLGWGGKPKRVASVLFTRGVLLVWLLRHTRPREDVIVYHSLGYAWVVGLAKRVRRFRLVLEVEEMYADVSDRARDRRAERRLFAQADAFIVSTKLLADALDLSGRPHVVAHGTYTAEECKSVAASDGRVHVVYAGTFDRRKGGCLVAIAAAEHLDERYHVHILGFGNEQEMADVSALIEDMSRKTACRVTLDGLLTGDQYSRFLQSCNIGLSTQQPDAIFNHTSFPSKVLSYLANGLRVVTGRLKSLEQSGVNDLLYYYDVDTAEAVADAIMAIDLNAPYDSRARLRELDEAFVSALPQVLSSHPLTPTAAVSHRRAGA